MKYDKRFEDWRVTSSPHLTSPAGVNWGAFDMPGPCGRRLFVVSSGADGPAGPWEHVSCSTHKGVPNWQEMCFVKNLFWDDETTIVQYHPKRSEYVNNHPNVLHLWRWTGGEFPTPPAITVGFKDLGITNTPQKLAEALTRRDELANSKG